MSGMPKFDWAECRALRAEGWGVTALARKYGVNRDSVYYVLNGDGKPKPNGPKPRPRVDRFVEKFEKRGADECWPWTGNLDRNGYGQFMLYRQGRSIVKYIGAHRFSYEHFVGPIPKGLVIDHLCRNPACVNPSHLEPVTNGENIRRGFAVTLGPLYPCGHPRGSENSYYNRSKNGSPTCRTCAKERTRKQRRAA